MLQINKNRIVLLFIREEMIAKVLIKWSFGPQKMLVFESKGEGCHRSAKTQENLIKFSTFSELYLESKKLALGSKKNRFWERGDSVK